MMIGIVAGGVVEKNSDREMRKDTLLIARSVGHYQWWPFRKRARARGR